MICRRRGCGRLSAVPPFSGSVGLVEACRPCPAVSGDGVPGVARHMYGGGHGHPTSSPSEPMWVHPVSARTIKRWQIAHGWGCDTSGADHRGSEHGEVSFAAAGTVMSSSPRPWTLARLRPRVARSAARRPCQRRPGGTRLGAWRRFVGSHCCQRRTSLAETTNLPPGWVPLPVDGLRRERPTAYMATWARTSARRSRSCSRSTAAKSGCGHAAPHEYTRVPWVVDAGVISRPHRPHRRSPRTRYRASSPSA